MREHWKLPPEDLFRYTGVNWLQLLLQQLDDETRARTLLILWRAWHLRNDIIHNDRRATIAESVAFLRSYLTSTSPQLNTVKDRKGKQKMFLISRTHVPCRISAHEHYGLRVILSHRPENPEEHCSFLLQFGRGENPQPERAHAALLIRAP
jgi:hypothetical protein